LSLSFTRRPHFDAGGKNSFPLRREIFAAPRSGLHSRTALFVAT